MSVISALLTWNDARGMVIEEGKKCLAYGKMYLNVLVHVII